MTPAMIIAHRLLNQGLIGGNFKTPEMLLDHMIAIQSQEFAPARWAIGLRVTDSTDQQIADLFNNGIILRTHLLRPTWHFISPANIRWVTMLTAPHITRASKYYHRQQSLDAPLFSRTRKILEKILAKKNFMTRPDIETVFNRHKITAKGIALSYIMMDAELNCVICSGPRKGNQFTYALMDEMSPPGKQPGREEALGILLSKFIRSRGPVSLRDFSYWSGLTLSDAKLALALADTKLHNFEYNGQQHYIFADQVLTHTEVTALLKKHAAAATILLPDYDEYLMSYKDKSLLQPIQKDQGKTSLGYNRMIIHHGRIAAEWRRPANTDEIKVGFAAHAKAAATLQAGVKRASKKYLQFIKS